MNRKLMCMLLTVALLAAVFSSCDAVSEIAGNVADAAMEELENQVKATFEKYKVDVIELKSAVGKLNGTEGDIQFFCAALVQSDSESLPQSCADALAKIFHDAGIMVQTGSKIESPYLEHKELSFNFTGFEEGVDYYVIYAYTDRIPSLIPTETGEGVG